MELHSSAGELVLQSSSYPPQTLKNPHEILQNPKSSELGFNTPATDHRGDSMAIDNDEELKKKNQDKQLNEGFGNDENTPDEEDGQLRKSLDEEIHQVIYVEALHEAVMNLALEDEGNEMKLRDSSINEEGINRPDQAEMSDVGEGNDYNNNWNYEINEKIGEVNGWEDSGWGRIGNVDESEGQNGEEGDYEENYYGTEEGENGGEYAASNQDGIDNNGGGSRIYGRRVMYPLRPEAEECSYYMKTGNCKFGTNCKFNHPPRRSHHQGLNMEKAKPNAEDSEWPGHAECKYYLTSGGCKFGKACKYSHSRERTIATPVSPILEFNFLGLPIRSGEKECPYYMRTGSCKYGSNCRFNHPDPTSVSRADPASDYGNGGSFQLQGAAQSSHASWSSGPMIFPPAQATPQSNPEWNGYQAPAYPTSERSLPAPPALATSERSLPIPPAFAMNKPAAETNFYSRHQQQMPVDEYPERPGQPECSYFLRTGDCKYKSNCRYHHPKIRLSNSTPFALSEKGLPLRPGQSVCSYYSRYGICKYGPSCKFDHPENWGNTTPSGGARMTRQEMEAGFS